jgi:hypothetical protein
MRVQREPPSVVRSSSRSRSFSFVRSLSLCLSVCVFLRRCFGGHPQSPDSAALVVPAWWVQSLLAGCEAKFRNFPSQYPRLPCTLQIFVCFNNTTIELTRRSRDIHERGAPLRKFCSPEDPPFTPLP